MAPLCAPLSKRPGTHGQALSRGFDTQARTTLLEANGAARANPLLGRPLLLELEQGGPAVALAYLKQTIDGFALRLCQSSGEPPQDFPAGGGRIVFGKHSNSSAYGNNSAGKTPCAA